MSDGEQPTDIMAGLKTVLSQIEKSAMRRSKNFPEIVPRLVCVSKLKPTNLIIEAYNSGQKHFGENYVNELHDKANSPDILENCKNIQWHFIGHLQTNKVNKLLGSPGLHIVETVHSEKIADALNKAWPKFANGDRKLNVMVQINTSSEDAKSGIDPSEVSSLVEHIMRKCSNLQFKGLMTIGQYGYDLAQGPNPDFITLAKARELLCTDLTLDVKDVGLSMGMSNDFEHAIEMGATNVRVGSSIFGARPIKPQSE